MTNLDIQFVLMKSMYLDFGDAEVKVEGLLRQPEGRGAGILLVGIVPNPYMTEKGRDERICCIPHTTITN